MSHAATRSRSEMAKPLYEDVVFIIGAGHSISACGPTTADLTKWIVAGEGPVDRSKWPNEEKVVLQRVLEHLSVVPNPPPTYESIFTWLWSRYFSDDPHMYRVAWDSEDPFAAIGLAPRNVTKPIAYKVLRCIEKGVAQALHDSRLQPDHAPQLIVQAALDQPVVKRLTLITLNHDRVLEHLLNDARVDYDDGFGGTWEAGGTWMVGDPDRRNCTHLIKLHGSIDWWSPEGWNDASLVHRGRDRLHDPKKRPLILVGTGPKLFQSSNLIFARQVLDAGRALANASCIVIVGYGFGDVRMNSLWDGATKDQRTKKAKSPPVPTLVIDTDREGLRRRLQALERAGDLWNRFTSDEWATHVLEGKAVSVTWHRCKVMIEEMVGRAEQARPTAD